MSFLAYKHRAMAIRRFCPELMFIPLSPISVKSPPFNSLMSSRKEQMSITFK